MTTSISFSIVTPTLDAGDTLQRAIDSVVTQGYTAWEHIVVDGGSTDDTLTVVARNPQIRLESQPGGTVFAAMNRGIEIANGDWIYFLGADDMLTGPNVLERVAGFIRPELDVIYGDVVSPRFSGRYGGEFDAKRILKQNICHQAIFFHRELFGSIGRFNETYVTQADWDHNMRWLLNPEIKKAWVDLVVAEYADGGISSTQGDERFQRDIRFRYVDYGHRVIEPHQLTLMSLRQALKYAIRFNAARVIRCLRSATTGMYRWRKGLI